MERRLAELKKEGLPPSGKAGGVLSGEYPNPGFAKEPAYKAELENETTARKEVDAILKGEGEAEKASREAAVKAEKEAREAADALEKSKREEADNERVKGPASATTEDIATYNGATGKIIKDSGKTIASVLQEAKETAEALASASAAGLVFKAPVAYATTVTLITSEATEKTLRGPFKLTIDGVSLIPEGTRLLIKNQATETQNGIYTLTENKAIGGTGKIGGEGKEGEAGWLLTRATDADTTEEVKQGMYVNVLKGTKNAGTSWLLSTEDPIVIGTSNQTFGVFSATPAGTAGGGLTGTYPNPTLSTSSKELFPQLPTAGVRKFLMGQISAAGAVVLGAGFTSEKTGTGLYTIKITTELATSAVLSGTPVGVGVWGFLTQAASTKAEVKVERRNALGALADEAFNFTISG